MLVDRWNTTFKKRFQENLPFLLSR